MLQAPFDKVLEDQVLKRNPNLYYRLFHLRETERIFVYFFLETLRRSMYHKAPTNYVYT